MMSPFRRLGCFYSPNQIRCPERGCSDDERMRCSVPFRRCREVGTVVATIRFEECR